jgi:hypothetical protein
MDFKKKGDRKAWTRFIWLMIGTVVIYNPHDTVQHPTNTECSATWLPETQFCVTSKSHHLTMAQAMGITNLNASHSLLLFYPQLLWTMSTSPKCMPLVKAPATSICGNGVGNIRKCHQHKRMWCRFVQGTSTNLTTDPQCQSLMTSDKHNTSQGTLRPDNYQLTYCSPSGQNRHKWHV